MMNLRARSNPEEDFEELIESERPKPRPSDRR